MHDHMIICFSNEGSKKIEKANIKQNKYIHILAKVGFD